MEIKALIFDFGGTLVKGSMDWREFHGDIIKLLSGHGHNVDPDELRQAVSVTMKWLEDNRKGDVEPTFDEVYSRILSKLKVPSDAEILCTISNLYRERFQVRLLPCSEDIIKELSKKYKFAIISNTLSDIPRLFLRKSDLEGYFELIVCSSDLGIRKPDPRIFHFVLSRLGVKPSEALHIGDGLKTDVEGATRAGIRAIWIRESGESSSYEPSIDSICELTSLVKKIESEDKPRV